jgi:hypothetical protein
MAVNIERVSVSLDPAVVRLLQKRAKAEGVTVSRYVQTAIIMDAMMSGEVDAVRLIGARLREVVRERVAPLLTSKQPAT